MSFTIFAETILEIFNAAGQLVHSQDLMGMSTLNVDSWARGGYQIQVLSANGASVAYPLVLQ